MPKTTRETIHNFNARMVRQYPNILEIECSQLYCKLCHCNINGTKTFTIQQHFRTMKHQSAVQNVIENDLEDTSYLLPEAQIQLNDFNLDLCTMFLEANIPLETINNPVVQTFLQKYTQNPIPNERTLRLEYIPTLYEKYIYKLQNIAENKQIWISISETIDIENNLVVSFVFGLLEEKEKGKSYMLNMNCLGRANASTLAAFFNNSLQILWPNGINYENVRLVITNAIPYMKAALQSLKILFPNMIYINCLLQSYYRLSEYLRVHFKEVEEFLTICEAVFLKSPYRQHTLRKKLTHLNLPPTLSSSKSGNWLKAAIYYCGNFSEITNLLGQLSEEDDIECLRQTKQLMENATLKKDLLYIKEHFECLALSINKLESRGLPLNESLATIENIKAGLQSTKHKEWIDKFDKIINENCDLKRLNDEVTMENNLLIKNEDQNAEERNLWTFKYAPVVATDVENLSYPKSLLENEKSFHLKSFKKEKYEIL